MMNLMQSGVASAERVFELLDADEQRLMRRAERTRRRTRLIGMTGLAAAASVVLVLGTGRVAHGQSPAPNG